METKIDSLTDLNNVADYFNFIPSVIGLILLACTHMSFTTQLIIFNFIFLLPSQHETILANGITHAIDYRTIDYVQAVKK